MSGEKGKSWGRQKVERERDKEEWKGEVRRKGRDGMKSK